MAAVLSGAFDDGVRSLVTELAVEPVRMAADPDARYADELRARLRIHGIERQIVQVKSRVTRLDPVADAEAYAAAFGELFALEKRRREDLEGGLGG